ncbi:site-specific tyrosine recombinase XerD [Phocoenobacter skyensis]|uniref:Tyrosine recombinase XerD n=1 Tax=Phocoenobacter skyensis TaxID=97481 RepID=A0A1H7XXS4_9PAST|nr:site-specific tyrosine recombinase XerD [Pasteurella skyensis]MDP8079817.1 site-specific tyrosine recombinase XerD [Pasteurella skyensis]MDP8085714.1 site-specific tyrosine recombinase XerD [Pasteurella skyensis]MDP8185542.1 site-specific tyrosine recombinase XerD [Pasteurella skyensis]QLB21803.1 site-specific tyrosine recombinase XerD [Pasteurella skyensis]SEM38465.1 integrase/recombinase XerD [Pasteurella skyensis]
MKKLDSIIELFLDSLWQEHGLSENTIASYRQDLDLFSQWLSTKHDFLTLDHFDLQAFLGQRLEQGYKASSSARMLSCLRKFFRFLYLENYRSDDPTATLMSPKKSQRLPKSLSEEQVLDLLNTPNTLDPIELRDKAMLELLYATGLRVTELVSLTLENLSLRQGVVRVIGKGDKERLVPIGEEANYWINEFLLYGRPLLLKNEQSDVLFPSRRGTQMTRQTFWHRIKHYALLADIESDKLSPHILRHAFATHLVNYGADLRVVQMLLGHSDLSTTQIYTQVAKSRLQSLHQKYHPRG